MPFGFRNPGWVAFAILVLLVMAVGCTSKDSPFGERNRGLNFSAKREADDKAGNKKQITRRDCNKDQRKLCKDVKPGGGRINECLVKNLDKLSRRCKTYMSVWAAKKEFRETRQQKNKAWKEACSADEKKLCANTKNKNRCIAENLDKVSAKCKRLASAELNPCLLDRIKLCGSAKDGNKCMKENAEKVSQACVADRNKKRESFVSLRKLCRKGAPKECRGPNFRKCLREDITKFSLDCQAAYYKDKAEAS